MNREERLPLLERMAQLAHEEGENDVVPEQAFLPLASHRLALRPEIVVVRGGRGAGKSALFRLLARLGHEARDFFEDAQLPAATWLDAFSDLEKAHPSVMTLDALASRAADSGLRSFWLAHLLARCAATLDSRAKLPDGFSERVMNPAVPPSGWIGWAEQNIESISISLDRIERDLAGRPPLFAAYDHLDRIGQHDPAIRGRYVTTLLSMWLSLSNRYRSLRAKIFLRDDLFDAAERAFADASKLRPRSVTLEWTVEDLFRAAVRQLASPSTDRDEERVMLGWLQEIKHVNLHDRGRFGFIPGPMPEQAQKSFTDQLAGEIMGTGAKKAFTYRWIPNRLQDAKHRIVPRTLLNLLGFAAAEAKRSPLGDNHRLMKPEDLSQALVQVSTQRAKEVAQEYPLVLRLHNLAGLQLLLDKEIVIEMLAKPHREEPADLSRDGKSVFDELVDLGVLKVRPDGRIDVPDVYRHGFKIKRKGGVARPQ